MRLLAVLPFAVAGIAFAADPVYDLVFRHARVVDGTGGAAYLADLAVRGDTIVRIAPSNTQPSLRVVDLKGLVAAPGFIDIHTHSGRGIFNVPTADNYSRDAETVVPDIYGAAFDWIITSPPYYGMRTYVQDQWLRNWFVGGPDSIDYSVQGQLGHMSAEAFSDQLSQVWANVARVCNDDARLVIRFGGIRDRNADPLELVKQSLQGSPWRTSTLHDAGSADSGERQANVFLASRSTPIAEHDIWTRLG